MMHVYRAYDAQDSLLYVGIARRWPARWQAHAARATWYPEVARLALEAHGTDAAARAAEAAAIRDEQPRYNVRGVSEDDTAFPRDGLRCPTCGTVWASMRHPLYVVGRSWLFSPAMYRGGPCGDWSQGQPEPCPGRLVRAT